MFWKQVEAFYFEKWRSSQSLFRKFLSAGDRYSFRLTAENSGPFLGRAQRGPRCCRWKQKHVAASDTSRACLMEIMGKARWGWGMGVGAAWLLTSQCEWKEIDPFSHGVDLSGDAGQRKTWTERKSYFSGVSFSGAAMGAAGWPPPGSAGADQETAAVEDLQSQRKKKRRRFKASWSLCCTKNNGLYCTTPISGGL